ncbi:hypothetical protein Prudu_25S001300 [Prunus dulcis]|uniref:Uncharacterized protein n=1 Tax=Prunus dulcis TaxID=3755 RepID=A0A5H2XSE4_PRUDU|nr:hypothetical protein Prudu_25S001300 [Prunus dulcis]
MGITYTLMELTKAIRIGHFTGNLGKQLLMLVEMFEEDDGHSRYSFVSEEIDMDDNDFGDFGCTVSVVDQDLLNQAHLYVLENTEEVLPHIEQHMIHMKTAYPKFRKRTKWLQDKHNSTFIQWLRFEVQSELEEDNHGVSENLRWLAAGPNMAVPLYRSYLIKGIKFNIKAQDDVRTTQNSGVYLLAHTMQVASAKDKNPILSNMGFYGSFKKFGTLTTKSLQSQSLDLSKIGHRNDQFVLASQVKQIFFIDDPMHRGWSVVLSMPNREYNDVIGDEVLGDVIIECEPFTRGMPNVDTFDELVGKLGSQNIRGGAKIYGLNDAYVLATKQSVQKILDPDYIIIFCIKNDVCSNKTRRYVNHLFSIFTDVLKQRNNEEPRRYCGAIIQDITSGKD